MNKISPHFRPRGEFPFSSLDFVTIIADASFCQHTKAYGWAGWCKYADGRIIETKGNGYCTTSLEAEVLALTNTITEVMERVDFTDRIIVIQSDCVGALHDLPLDLIRAANPRHIKLKHVKGHTNNPDARSRVNRWVDGEAYRQMRQARAAAGGISHAD